MAVNLSRSKYHVHVTAMSHKTVQPPCTATLEMVWLYTASRLFTQTIIIIVRTFKIFSLVVNTATEDLTKMTASSEPSTSGVKPAFLSPEFSHRLDAPSAVPNAVERSDILTDIQNAFAEVERVALVGAPGTG